MTPLFGDSRSSASVERLSLAGAVDEYLKYCAAGRGHTARAKQLDLKSFLAFLTSYRRRKAPAELTVGDWDASSVQAFIEHCFERGESPATVTRRLATLKHMGRLLAERVAGFVNPAREIKSPRMQVLRPQALSRDEIDAVIERAQERIGEKPSFTRRRNLVLLSLLLDTGLRADEIRLLRLLQVEPSLEWLRNVRTKGRKFRSVYVTTAMRPMLSEYLTARAVELKRFFPKLSPSTDARLPLFISAYRAKPQDSDSFFMSPKTLWRTIRELTVETKLHPHLLRHSFALDLLESSKDVRLVSQALGHSDVRVTMRYTERLDEEVARAVESSRRRKGQ